LYQLDGEGERCHDVCMADIRKSMVARSLRRLGLLLIIGALLQSTLAAAATRWQESLDGLALEAVRADMQLAAARNNSDFWQKWRQTDRAVVKLFHRDPAFGDAVRFHDPEQLVDAYPMLLHAMVTNGRWLHTLGRHRDAGRVRRAAARLAAFAAADETLWSTLILNTISRFLLAGWRDVDDPVSTVEFQIHQALSNAEQLRGRVKGAPPAPRTPRWRAAVLTTILHPLPPWWPLRMATLLVPVSPDMVLAPLLVAGPPLQGNAVAGEHNPLLDDLTYALNLPFGFAPPGTPVTRHLAQLPASLPEGTAILLGAGDGAEALAVASTGRFKQVTVVEHSSLAVVRTEQLAARLARWLDNLGVEVEIEAVVADVHDYQIPPNSCSLAMAIHLLEYLPLPERQQLYDSLQSAMLPGGQILFSVHLAEGPRHQSLVADYANIHHEETPDGVQITLSQMVPAEREAVQIQTFFHQDRLRAELERGFPVARFDTRATMEKTPAGFAEYTVVLTRKENDPVGTYQIAP
jgi:hypothetical protein